MYIYSLFFFVLIKNNYILIKIFSWIYKIKKKKTLFYIIKTLKLVYKHNIEFNLNESLDNEFEVIKRNIIDFWNIKKCIFNQIFFWFFNLEQTFFFYKSFLYHLKLNLHDTFWRSKIGACLHILISIQYWSNKADHIKFKN